MRIVNVPDISPADDRFVDLGDRLAPVEWVRLSGLPANIVERAVRRPRLSRYRAALQAAGAVSGETMLISHLPRMTAAVERALRLRGRRAPHLAFSFNFTALPDGRKRQAMANAFARVARFAVFSRFERELYARHFDLDPARIQPVIWTQEAPAIAPAAPAMDRPFVCAIGGEGRDFPTLMAALARLPASIGAAVIARPHSLIGLDIPGNVRVFTDLPPPVTWALARASMGVLVPLLGPETCCGHVTLVSAKLLGLPLVTSFSEATRDYVEDREAVLVTPPGDVAALGRAIERLADEQAALAAVASRAMPAERAGHDRAIWADYIARFAVETRC